MTTHAFERGGRWILIGLLGLLLAPLTARAQSDLVVDAAWLKQHLHDPGLVLLQMGPDSAFDQGHIPGTRFVDYDSWVTRQDPSGLRLQTPDPAAFQALLRSLSVGEDSELLVYWSEEWVTPTARIVFTLDWAGLGERTHLLNGGLEAWAAAGGAVTTDATPDAAPGDVVIRPRTSLIVDADWIRDHADDGALLDARAPAVYDGVREDQGKKGHLPGARSLPWQELYTTDDGGRAVLKDPPGLREAFAARGVTPGEPVTVYCHIGQFATAVILGARVLGHPVRLYDGSFQDWAARDLPVETGAGGRRP